MNLLREKQRASGHHLALLGGGGSSSSSTSQTTNQTDNRRVIGQNGVSAENSTVTYNLTDGGTVAAALNLVGNVTSSAQTNAADSLNSTTKAISSAYASARGQGALTEYVLIGALALVGLISYYAIKK